MGNALSLRDDYDAAGLRKLARRCRDDRQSCRLLAIASVYEGMSRADAARIGGMDRQTLRDWVHRFNDEGLDGLKDRHGGGTPRALNRDQTQWIIDQVHRGPDLDKHGVVRWRVIDLCALIKEEFGVTIKRTAMRRVLHENSLANLTARPQSKDQDPEKLEALKKTSRQRNGVPLPMDCPLGIFDCPNLSCVR